jgi:hypothetical protein
MLFLRHAVDSPKILENFSPKPGIDELHYSPGVLFWSAKTSDLEKSAMLKINRMPIYQEMSVRGLTTTRKKSTTSCAAQPTRPDQEPSSKG